MKIVVLSSIAALAVGLAAAKAHAQSGPMPTPWCPPGEPCQTGTPYPRPAPSPEPMPYPGGPPIRPF